MENEVVVEESCMSASDEIVKHFNEIITEDRNKLLIYLIIRKTMLPNRDYIDIAIKLALGIIDENVSEYQRLFAMVISLASEHPGEEFVNILKKLSKENLPAHYQIDYDFFICYFCFCNNCYCSYCLFYLRKKTICTTKQLL